MILDKELKIAEQRRNVDALMAHHPDCTLICLVITGSVAYGTDMPYSDIDLKGVYIQDMESVLCGKTTPQIGGGKVPEGFPGDKDAAKDVTLYELGRFMELVKSNNPNIMELLYTRGDCVVYSTPTWDTLLVEPARYLSKKCFYTFVRYAQAQIAKSKGLNKKINNPMSKHRKTPLDFCTVIDVTTGKTHSLNAHLERHGMEQRFCGLSSANKAEGVHFLYYDYNAEHYFSDKLDEDTKARRKAEASELGLLMDTQGFKGIISPDDLDSNDLRLSVIPLGKKPLTIIHYNRNAYTRHCRTFKEYWQWDKKKNPERFKTNTEHGKGYDSKNMAHCIRLLNMAVEIFRDGVVNVYREDREELLRIRLGTLEHEAILSMCDDRIALVTQLHDASQLPEEPDTGYIDGIYRDTLKRWHGI